MKKRHEKVKEIVYALDIIGDIVDGIFMGEKQAL